MKSPSFKGQFVFTDNQDWAANGVADTLEKSPDSLALTNENHLKKHLLIKSYCS